MRGLQIYKVVHTGKGRVEFIINDHRHDVPKGTVELEEASRRHAKKMEAKEKEWNAEIKKAVEAKEIELRAKLEEASRQHAKKMEAKEKEWNAEIKKAVEAK